MKTFKELRKILEAREAYIWDTKPKITGTIKLP